MEQEVIVRQRDEALSQVARREREHEALLETAQKALANTEAERDEARAHTSTAAFMRIERQRDEARAEVEMLRGVGCREAKAGEPESGPCGVCLKCAEERGAKWALTDEQAHDLELLRSMKLTKAEKHKQRDERVAHALREYARFMIANKDSIPTEQGRALDRALRSCPAIIDIDEVWIGWRHVGDQMGWLTVGELKYDEKIGYYYPTNDEREDP
jgi:hypothetical protein